MVTPWPAPCGYLDPPKQPADVTQRSFIIAPSPALTLVSATLAARPSGAGELALSAFTVAYTTATVTVSGGVAGRVYTLEAVAVDSNGDDYTTLAYLAVDGTLVVDPPVVPPSPDFGTPLTWTV